MQGCWKRVAVILLGTSCASKLVKLVFMLSHVVWMELSMVNVWVNDVMNACASCLCLLVAKGIFFCVRVLLSVLVQMIESLNGYCMVVAEYGYCVAS